MTKRTPVGLTAGLLLLAFALTSCGSDPAMPEFSETLGIDLTAMTHTSSGLCYADLVVGEGALAEVGKTAQVKYAGWLADGRLFDSGTFSFTVGVGQVVEGFDEGVLGMRVGGKRKMVIPPDLGYGGSANGRIPANSTLVFEVELQTID